MSFIDSTESFIVKAKPTPAIRLSLGRVRTVELKPPQRGLTGPGINTLILTDLQKFARWRRGMGPWSDSLAFSIFEDAAPRLIVNAQRTAEAGNPEVLVKWTLRHLPEVVEAWGIVWVREQFYDFVAASFGSYRVVDDIADRLNITQHDVEGAVLRSLVCAGSSKADRRAKNQKRNAERKREVRELQGATARCNSIAARHRRGEFGEVSLVTVRRRMKGEADQVPSVSSEDDHFSSVHIPPHEHFSSDAEWADHDDHLSSDTGRSP